MKQVARLFDYFKLAFAINKENKGLYKPQIILIILKTCLVIFTGFVIYDYFNFFEGIAIIDEDIIFAKVFSTIGIYLFIFLVSIFVKIAFEAGLYNMYKDCIKDGGLHIDSFSVGIRTYFAKFLLADILLLLAWILMLVPYVIIGFVTMFAGFVIIPIIISIFIAMWKVAIVMDDQGIIDSLKKSFGFAKSNFWPLSFLIIIKNSFIKITNGGGSTGNNVSNINSNNNVSPGGANPFLGDTSNLDFLPEATNFYDPSVEVVLHYVKIFILIFIPIISIAVVISSLIKMIFDVFFSLSIFVMYTENTKLEAKEIIADDPSKIDLTKEVL